MVQDHTVRADSPIQQARRAPMSSLIDIAVGLKKHPVSCCIPLINESVSLPIEDFDDFSHVLLRDSPDYVWKTKLCPNLSLASKWVDISTAFTLVDIRTATTGVYLSPVLGTKLICIPDCFVDVGAEKGLSDFPPNTKWFVLYVENGDQLFIPPGVQYFEANIDNCLTIGGNFYCGLHFTGILSAMTIKHQVRNVLVPSPWPSSPVIFFKILDSLLQTVNDRKEMGVEDMPYRFPSCNQIAALLILVNHMDQLAPGDNNSQAWQNTDAFRADHAHAKRLVRRFLGAVDSQKFDEAILKISDKFMKFFDKHNERHPDRPDLHMRFVHWA
ncbi:hypothetical protein DFH11DRAFT_1556784 [Phellopilus nigrolimitatus]|nr:hypothetical protein DFH11DRAFT_1556784 [Phellopilus nigrolimitatus]